MQQIKQHIISKICLVFLTVVMLSPTFVKLHHIFENHEHVVCIDNSIEHLHEIDLECEFYKFKINPQISFSSTYKSLNYFEHNFKTYIDSQSVLSDFQLFHFSLRGPPSLI